MDVAYRCEPFDQHLPAPVKDLAMLHTALLPQSPIVKLGPRFIEQVYYTVLPREGYIFGATAYVDQVPAGFIVATADSNGFMRTALRRCWWILAKELTLTILLTPSRLKAIGEVLILMRSAPRRQMTGREGEILSMGVLPAYADAPFIRRTRFYIAEDLFDMAMQRLQSSGVNLIRAIVDADNKPARFFYQAQEWSLEHGQVPGWKVPSVEYVWRLP